MYLPYRDEKKYFIEFNNGKAKSPLKVVGKSKVSGTKITFLPSKDVFSSIKFSGNILIKRMREYNLEVLVMEKVLRDGKVKLKERLLIKEKYH